MNLQILEKSIHNNTPTDCHPVAGRTSLHSSKDLNNADDPSVGPSVGQCKAAFACILVAPEAPQFNVYSRSINIRVYVFLQIANTSTHQVPIILWRRRIQVVAENYNITQQSFLQALSQIIPPKTNNYDSKLVVQILPLDASQNVILNLSVSDPKNSSLSRDSNGCPSAAVLFKKTRAFAIINVILTLFSHNESTEWVQIQIISMDRRDILGDVQRRCGSGRRRRINE